MKRMAQNQSQKARHRSSVYALPVVFLGCLLVLGIAELATPSQSSSAGADRPSILVPNPSTADSQTKSADGVWSNLGQSGMANVQQQRVDIRSFRSVASTFNGVHQLSVPVVRLNEFLSDTQEIGLGVVVNQGNWQ